MELHEIINQIETTPSKNEKLAILKAHVNNPDLKEFFYLALEPTVLFWIKAIPAYKPEDICIKATSLMDATYDLVNKVASRDNTGDAARDIVADLLSSLTNEDAELLKRIVLKDARCGVSEKTINKVWKGLCTEKLYMRCASFNEKNLNKVNYPALVQLKADGLFMNIIRDKNHKVTFLSRNMKPMTLHGNLELEILAMDIPDGTVIHGEGLVSDGNGGFLDRKTGNGIISKAIKGTISKEEAALIHLKVWDLMPLESWKAKKCDFPYEIRLRTLEKGLGRGCQKIKIIATQLVTSLDGAYEFFNRQLARGQEGAILKNMDGIWKNHTSPNQVKMKKKDPADLLCTGTYPFKQATVNRGGTVIDTSNWIGGLNLESSDGKIKTNSGSGLNDELRAMPPEYFINHIWETEYNEIITSKSKDTASLFLPIIKGRRDDKDEADSYELILERAKGNSNKAK